MDIGLLKQFNDTNNNVDGWNYWILSKKYYIISSGIIGGIISFCSNRFPNRLENLIDGYDRDDYSINRW